MMGRVASELVDIAAQIRRETEKAWLLFDGTKESWVPKSQVEDNGDGTFTMPTWLAERAGFFTSGNRNVDPLNQQFSGAAGTAKVGSALWQWHSQLNKITGTMAISGPNKISKAQLQEWAATLRQIAKEFEQQQDKPPWE